MTKFLIGLSVMALFSFNVYGNYRVQFGKVEKSASSIKLPIKTESRAENLCVDGLKYL